MNNFEIINENLIELNVEATTKNAALEKVSIIAFENRRVSSMASYLDGLLERENTSTTGFGDGIAIPHAKVDEVLEPTITVVKLKDAVEWKALDDKPVKLLIALAVPKKQEGTLYLQLIAKLSENLMDDSFKDALISSNSKEEMLKSITKIF